ncbi:hypothetical protein QL285_046212 [Trifolium repens]|nr:hypothetical protein QL285_046212 [Trifolium repens]
MVMDFVFNSPYKKLFQKNKLLHLKNICHSGDPREKREIQYQTTILYSLQGHEVNNGMMDYDLIRFHQAMKSSNSQRWIDAVNKVMKFIMDNDIWYLFPLP